MTRSGGAKAGPTAARSAARSPVEAVVTARRTLLEGVGQEVAASFPGITRLGGQIVAALYLADVPGEAGRSMDELSAELGRSKSNIFANLRALEAAGIVERRRSAGARHDRFALRGPYPDVMIGAYVARLRRMVSDKRALVDRSLAILGDAKGEEAELLRRKLDELGRKYGLFGEFFQRVGPALDAPIDLEPMLRDLPPEILDAIAELAAAAVSKR
ncbi:MAG: MarR family transcriptional regulator [Deltaproteobacteria bacterium]|nr:MarR family transcriptional regulator [Deltaproteobacteria bacterium]